MHVVARNSVRNAARIPTGREAFSSATIPHGFVPVEQLKSLPAMGRWPSLPDGMPPWLPFHALVEMARQEQRGVDTAREWLETYRYAVQGDPDAQRSMGRSCEAGAEGVAPDLPRAFFWYYRAALAGHEAASDDALRLKAAHDIPEAAMEEPSLVYPGQWRLRREEPERTDAVVLELCADGRLSGPGANGLWSYDRARRTLTLAHHETVRLRLVACRDIVLFGCDEQGAACTLERTGPSGAR